MNTPPTDKTSRDRLIADLIATHLPRKMTAKEAYDQRVSFIYGQLPEESTTTIEQIKEHLAEQGMVDPASLSAARPTEPRMAEMVDRFLAWKLPEDFHPDAGISFSPHFNVEYNAKHGKPPQRHEPIGTNLFTATQTMEMLRHVLNNGCDCPNPHQCWEPCGELGHSAEHARVAGPEEAAAVDKAVLSSERPTEWPYGKATLEASAPLPTYDEHTPPGGRSAGFLLYCHVYEARWAALKTAEYCPNWSLVPEDLKQRWEALAGSIATEAARKAPNSASESLNSARLVSVRRQGSSVGPIIGCTLRTDDGVIVNLSATAE
jgi:hypothetical protein